jgi:hypothetical protein
MSSSPRVAAKIAGCGPTVGERKCELNDRCVAVAAGGPRCDITGDMGQDRRCERRFGFPSPNSPNPGQFRTRKSLELTFFSFSELSLFKGLYRLLGQFFLASPRRRIKTIIYAKPPGSIRRARGSRTVNRCRHGKITIARVSIFRKRLLRKNRTANSLLTQSGSLAFADGARPSRPNRPIPTRISHSPPGLSEIDRGAGQL